MHNFTIRPALLSDVPAILDLTVDGIRVWGSHISSNLKPWLDEVCCSTYISSKINNPYHHIYIAENNGAIVGTVYLNRDNGEIAHMGGLYCSLKRSGLGTVLLQHAMNEAISHGYALMECAIYENNVASISLMSKYGAIHTDTEIYDGIKYKTYQFALEKSLALI